MNSTQQAEDLIGNRIESKSLSSCTEVAIVIVNYNGFDDVARCLASLEKQSDQNYRIILVDNNSTDGSGVELRAEFESERCHVICNPENSGFAGGNNVGIAYALSLGVEYIWLLNPDTECDPSALESLIRALEANPETGAVGSKVLYGGDPQRKIWSAGGEVDIIRQQVWMRGTDEIDSGQFDEVASCSYLPGCSVLARASLFAEVGFLPEKYFLYFEETDWCLRLRAEGYQLQYVPTSVVYHHFASAKMQGAMTVYYYNRNQRLFWLRYTPTHLKVRLWLKVLLKELPQAKAALQAAQTPEHQELFRAHVQSARDALLLRSGRRWKPRI